MKYIEFDASRPMDLVLLGRVAIDFNPAYNDQVKEEFKPLKKVHMFEKFVGGSPANIAVGVTRQGMKSGFIGKVSDDQFGDFVVDYFNEQGIDTSHITRCTGGEKLGLTFTEMLSPKAVSYTHLISVSGKTWDMTRPTIPIPAMPERNCSRYFSRNRKAKADMNRKSPSMNVKTALAVHIKKNVQKQRETNGCIFPRAFWKSVRNPMKIS